MKAQCKSKLLDTYFDAPVYRFSGTKYIFPSMHLLSQLNYTCDAEPRWQWVCIIKPDLCEEFVLSEHELNAKGFVFNDEWKKYEGYNETLDEYIKNRDMLDTYEKWYDEQAIGNNLIQDGYIDENDLKFIKYRYGKIPV